MPKGIYKIKTVLTIAEWLDQHGGRDFNDLEKNYKGYYVLMGNGQGGDKKVYLPKDLTK